MDPSNLFKPSSNSVQLNIANTNVGSGNFIDRDGNGKMDFEEVLQIPGMNVLFGELWDALVSARQQV